MQKKKLVHIYIALYLLITLVFSCFSDKEIFQNPTQTYTKQNTLPIPVNTFHKDKKIQARVLQMPLGEVIDRLGSFHLKIKNIFEFKNDIKSYKQEYQATLVKDIKENFHILIETSDHAIEFYFIDKHVYIRQDKGELRNKARNDIDINTWGELIFSSSYQALEPFYSNITFEKIETTTPMKQSSISYKIKLSLKKNLSNQLIRQKSNPFIAPPGKWRGISKPLYIEGYLGIDKKKGVLIDLHIKGELNILEPSQYKDKNPIKTSLTITHDSEITSVGNVEIIKKPKSIIEYKRKKISVDPLSFFRQYLPKKVEETK